MRKVKLHIPAMQIPKAQMLVGNVVESIAGAKIDRILPGEAELILLDEKQQAEVLTTIAGLGYEVTAIQWYLDN